MSVKNVGCGIGLACALAVCAVSARADACPDEPVVTRIDSVKFYSDAHASIVDPDKVRERKQLILPVRNFVTEASSRVDSADHAQLECAQRMMLGWARGKALLGEPADIAGQHDRQIFAISFNIIALKLQAAGFDIAPLLGWLGDLDRAVISYFEKRNHAAAAAKRPDAGWAPVDNLYVWSGVNAASYAVLGHDRDAQRYEDKVWSEAIREIRPDGYLESELRRGARALVYHAYELSALLLLERFRERLGEPVSAPERSALTRLNDRIGAALCDPSGMAAASGGFPQEKPNPTSVGTGFAIAPEFLTQQVRECLPDLPSTDPLFGGDLERTARILAGSHP